MSRVGIANVRAALSMLSASERSTLAVMLHHGRQKAIEAKAPYDVAGDFLGDDTDAINAFQHLIGRIAAQDDPPNVAKRQPGPRDQWCPVCHRYHFAVGEKTDAGRLVRECPLLPPGAGANREA